MSLNQARIDLETYIRTNWDTDIADLVFTGETEKGNRLIKGTNPWIQSYISWGSEKQISNPAPKAKFRLVGLLASRIRVRKEDGTGLIHSIADSYFDILRCKQINNITMQTPKIGKQDESESWQIFFTTTGFKVYYDKTILPI